MLWGYLGIVCTFLISVCMIALSIFVYKTFITPLKYWKSRNVVYKKPWPVFGNFGALLLRKEHFAEIANRIYAEFSNERYVGMWSFTKPSLMLRDLDLIKQVCIKDFDYFTDHQAVIKRDDDSIMGQTLISLCGKEWKEMRATLSPVFTGSKMKSMFPLMIKCAENLNKHFLKKNEFMTDIDAKEVFSQYTNDVIASTAFGIDINSFEDPENQFYAMGRELTNNNTFIRTLRFFLVAILPSEAKFFRIKMFPGYMANFFRSIVSEQIKKREEKAIVRPDLIHLLMEAKKGRLKYDSSKEATFGFASVNESDIGKSENLQIKELTDDAITAQAMIFFFAGFDTASTASSFMAQELAMNPDVQQKLQDEIDAEIQKCDEKLTYDGVLGLKFLDQVISETLRLWPPAVQTDRMCLKDYTIKSLSEGATPTIIEKNIPVNIPIMAIHRDSKYFENPNQFYPDRFTEENKSNIVPGSYIPFGLGPRNCIASRFALLEMKVLFVNLLSKFTVEVTKDTSIPLKLSSKKLIMAPENGFRLGLRLRQK